MRLFRRKRVPWDDPGVLRAMLLELHGFIVSELDPAPHPMEAYFTTPEYQHVARVLTRAGAARAGESDG